MSFTFHRDSSQPQQNLVEINSNNIVELDNKAWQKQILNSAVVNVIVTSSFLTGRLDKKWK